MSDERRQDKRFTVVSLDLHLPFEDKQIGHVVNLSEGGLLVHCDEPLKMDESYTFYIPFKETINGMIKLDFDAKVAWIDSELSKEGKHSIGLEFVENPEIALQFIHQMIKIFGS